jgi:hypothetical protein
MLVTDPDSSGGYVGVRQFLPWIVCLPSARGGPGALEAWVCQVLVRVHVLLGVLRAYSGCTRGVLVVYLCCSCVVLVLFSCFACVVLVLSLCFTCSVLVLYLVCID